MTFLRPLITPTDPRWQGPLRHASRILLVISALVVILWIFVIAQLGYNANANARYDKCRAERSRNCSQNIPPLLWGDVDDFDTTTADFFFSLLGMSLVLEFLHLPISFLLLTRHSLHPVAALVFSIVALGIWAFQATLACISAWAREYKIPADYAGLEWAMVAVAFVVLVLYLPYLVIAAMAVHRWRKGGKGRGAKGERIGGEMLGDLTKV